MNTNMSKLIAIAALSISSLAAYAGDAEKGKAKSAICAACHGPNGKSVVPIYPHLAGQQEQYLSKQLTAFRDGQRTDPIMAPMAAALSDEDIADLSAYFASLPAGG
jgi:cytochrome c553